MNLNKEFKTLVEPVIKGSPILIAIVAVALVVARRVANYSNPVYQTDAAIKIDNQDYGISNFFLFNEEGGPKQSLASAFLTEVELLKARSIKEKTFEKLDFEVSYYRVGNIRKTELYRDTPFKISDFEVFNKSFWGQECIVQYIGGDEFAYMVGEEQREILKFGEFYQDENFKFRLTKNYDFWKNAPEKRLKQGDNFAFVLHTIDDLVKEVNADNLFIKPIDKEITIIKVYVKDEVPEKAALFCNTFIDTYIEEARERKGAQTRNSLDFLNNEIADVEERLRNSETELTDFKEREKLVNLNQETDAVLKELTALSLTLVDFEVLEVELKAVLDFLQTENDISNFSANFKTISDKIFEDAFLKLKALEDERNDLLQRYTPSSAEVLQTQRKIANARAFLILTVRKKLGSLTEQRQRIEENIGKVNQKIELYPDKQRKIAELERDVALAAQTYTYLTEKRTQLNIAQSSDLVYHRVIDYAQVPKMPSAPNVPLIYGMFIFVALVVSLIIIYIRHYFVNTVETKDDLKTISTIPVLSGVSDVAEKHKKDVEPFINLYTNIHILQKDNPKTERGAWLIVVSSIMPNEGRTFVTAGLGRAMAHFGKRTLIVDLDNRKPKLHENFEANGSFGVANILNETRKIEDVVQPTGFNNLDLLAGGALSEIPEELVFSPKTTDMLDALKPFYDVIIVDTPPTAVHIEAVAVMHEADTVLYSVQANKSRVRFVKYISTFVEEYKIPNFYLILNGIRQSKGFYAKSYRLGIRRRLIQFLLRKN